MTIIGTNTAKILEHLPETFLIIDDGPIIDQLPLPKTWREISSAPPITLFDPNCHSFNPLKDTKDNYLKRFEFEALLNSIFPAGENTLTKSTFLHQVMEAMTEGRQDLATLIEDTKDTQYAYQKIQRLLFSPVLKNVLCKPTNFSMKGTVVARLNRKELGDFDCFVLGNLLIAQYQGHIVIPDFGFYACPQHKSLIREGRLTAGVNFLDEVPDLRNQILLSDTLGAHATFDDAETLAVYAGLPRGTNAFQEYVARAMA